MRRDFISVLYQSELYALKIKIFLIARNQNSDLQSYLLQTWMVQASYGGLLLENLIIHGYFRGIKKIPVTYKSNENSWMNATLFQKCLE